MTVPRHSCSDQHQAWLRDAFAAALRAGLPEQITTNACRRLGVPPTAVIALGKAAGAMADGVRAAGIMAPGVVITTDENHRAIDGFDCLAASHPVPDERGLAAAEAVRELVAGLGEDDHLLLLISGGGSALLPAPAAGISLTQKIALNDALLASGLDIHDMNVVRRLFSTLKGGRLARLAAPAPITQFLLSDVPGDRLESIASGVAVADPVDFTYAQDLVCRHGLDQLDFVAEHMAALAVGKADGPVRLGDPVIDKVTSQILASNAQCRNAAAAALAALVPSMTYLEAPELSGEAQKMAHHLGAQICNHKASGAPGLFGLVAGGETVVTMDRHCAGLGGRSQELALAFAHYMHKAGNAAPSQWAILAGGTDGRDGPTDAAGGLLTSAHEFAPKAAAAALDQHDSYHFLATIDGLVKTGATGTNLADLVLIICDNPPRP
jgi:hydroxypyruvate reductase